MLWLLLLQNEKQQLCATVVDPQSYCCITQLYIIIMLVLHDMMHDNGILMMQTNLYSTLSDLARAIPVRWPSSHLCSPKCVIVRLSPTQRASIAPPVSPSAQSCSSSICCCMHMRLTHVQSDLLMCAASSAQLCESVEHRACCI
jgi:hypothetical protein